ncbi:hypothetical protein B0O99DRAFT_262619 [Bisporella sp. PMI_857]|nr:hypothetical protein B0O99DRAFT_262619 [Bisporella sp. PMI_857]
MVRGPVQVDCPFIGSLDSAGSSRQGQVHPCQTELAFVACCTSVCGAGEDPSLLSACCPHICRKRCSVPEACSLRGSLPVNVSLFCRYIGCIYCEQRSFPLHTPFVSVRMLSESTGFSLVTLTCSKEILFADEKRMQRSFLYLYTRTYGICRWSGCDL